MINKRKTALTDIIVLTLIPLSATILSLIFNVSFLTSTLLFFGVPSIYLIFKNPKVTHKIGVFSLLWSLPVGILVDILAEVNKSWHVPYSSFPFRLFGFIPIEDLIWGFLLTFLILSYYEYFFDRHTFIQRAINKYKKRNVLENEIKKLGAFDLGLVILGLAIWTLFKFRIPYFYLVGGVLLVLVPVLVFIKKHPRLLGRFTRLTLLLLPQFLLFELVGLKLNQWTFANTEFIGWIELLGLRFPVEEFVVWFILTGGAVVTWFEVLSDDSK